MLDTDPDPGVFGKRGTLGGECGGRGAGEEGGKKALHSRCKFVRPWQTVPNNIRGVPFAEPRGVPF